MKDSNIYCINCDSDSRRIDYSSVYVVGTDIIAYVVTVCIICGDTLIWEDMKLVKH